MHKIAKNTVSKSKSGKDTNLNISNAFPIMDINTFSSLVAEESYTMPSDLIREQKLKWLSENQKKIKNTK